MDLENDFNYKKKREVNSMKVSRQNSKERSNLKLNLNENELYNINQYTFNGSGENSLVWCNKSNDNNGGEIVKKNLIDGYKKKLYGGKRKKSLCEVNCLKYYYCK